MTAGLPFAANSALEPRPSSTDTDSALPAEPCGSRSTSSVRWPDSASAAATLTAVVVLPTPPFRFTTATTAMGLILAGTAPGWVHRRRSAHGYTGPVEATWPSG